MRSADTRFRGVRFGVFEADLELYELRKHGVRIKLTGQPFQVLALLLEHAGEVVTREVLRQALWPNEPWGEHDQRLNKIVNKIREALCDSAGTPRFLETIPRIGYRFLVKAELFGDAPQAERDPLTTVVATPASPSLIQPPPVEAAGRPRWPWLLGGTVLLMSVLARGTGASYTDSAYPLQYYIELRQGPASAWLYPGFTAELTNQPYFVVRRA